jgi:sugar/nucleoside kinase (ribokinase family)
MKITDQLDGNHAMVVGVGSALMDILAHEDEDFLLRTGIRKGGMTLVDKSFIEQVLTLTASRPSLVPGGSACNTVVGISRLGGRSRFVGKCGNGDWGNRYRQDLMRQQVDAVLFPSDSPTGRVLSVITPDAQRSMATFLGASSECRPEELKNGCFADAAIVHIEGYLLFNPELILTAVETARAAGALISLDLASYTVVEGARDLLDRLVTESVDIVLANEDEARAFTGVGDELEALEILSQKTAIAVVKVGERGSYVAWEGQRLKIDPLGPHPAVDTTGAGDLWAAGFLYGLVNGYSMPDSGRLASACGYEVCRVVGAAIPDDGWRRIHRIKSELTPVRISPRKSLPA